MICLIPIYNVFVALEWLISSYNLINTWFIVYSIVWTRADPHSNHVSFSCLRVFFAGDIFRRHSSMSPSFSMSQKDTETFFWTFWKKCLRKHVSDQFKKRFFPDVHRRHKFWFSKSPLLKKSMSPKKMSPVSFWI